MRKLLLSILLAGVAATPALAGPDDREAREQARAERQQARESRAERALEARAEKAERVEREVRVDRPIRVEQVDRDVRVERVVEPGVRADAGDRAQAVGRADARDLQARREARRQSAETGRAPAVVAPERGIFRDRAEQRRQEVRERMAASRRPRPPVSTVPLPNTQPPPPVAQRPTQPVQWSGNWRDNHRYDWYNHRNRYRNLFHLGFYLDPFGWGYQRYNIGWRMWPSYYGSQYWLNDPWQYRLPYAPPGYRWVRYWDDAVLVDTWSGQVVDVIYNFFW
jgi:Ni/Co efflux regulator RcnB